MGLLPFPGFRIYLGTRIGAFDEDEAREILGIPPQIRVVALLPVGYPQDPSRVTKNRLSLEEIVKYERW